MTSEENRKSVISAIMAEKLVVIVRGVEKEKLVNTAEAMYAGGVRLIEITFDASGKTDDKTTGQNIALLSKTFEGRMYIGAGTVLSPEQVEIAANAGARFIISPDTNREVIRKTRELGLVSMPGAFTPTEVQTAHNYGADFVKLFPAGELPPSYLKAIKAPLSNIRIVAVGGISLDNIPAYLKAGACGFGISSSIVDKKLIAKEDYKELSLLAERYVLAVR